MISGAKLPKSKLIINQYYSVCGKGKDVPINFTNRYHDMLNGFKMFKQGVFKSKIFSTYDYSCKHLRYNCYIMIDINFYHIEKIFYNDFTKQMIFIVKKLKVRKVKDSENIHKILSKYSESILSEIENKSIKICTHIAVDGDGFIFE